MPPLISPTSAQIRQLRTLREILLGAQGAKAVVEMVDRREFLLADVALPGLFSFWNGLAGQELLRFRRIDVRRSNEDRLPA